MNPQESMTFWIMFGSSLTMCVYSAYLTFLLLIKQKESSIAKILTGFLAQTSLKAQGKTVDYSSLLPEGTKIIDLEPLSEETPALDFTSEFNELCSKFDSLDLKVDESLAGLVGSIDELTDVLHSDQQKALKNSQSLEDSLKKVSPVVAHIRADQITKDQFEGLVDKLDIIGRFLYDLMQELDIQDESGAEPLSNNKLSSRFTELFSDGDLFEDDETSSDNEFLTGDDEF